MPPLVQMGFEFLTIRTGVQLVLLNMVVAEDGPAGAFERKPTVLNPVAPSKP